MTDDRRHDEDERQGRDRRREGDGRESEQLRSDFRALRAEMAEAGRVPEFEAMVERARAEAKAAKRPPGAGGPSPSADVERSGPAGGSRWPRVGWWVPVAAAAAAVGLLLLNASDSDADADFERLVADYSSDVATWRSPTASLMDIPGVDLGSVPSIGSSLGGGDLPGADAPEGRDS